MGNLDSGSILLHDLKVTFHRSSTIYPSEYTEKRSMFLSNIDQVLNFSVKTIHFFAPDPSFPPEAIIEKLELALRKLLVPYDFLAGRLRFNPQEGRLEIDCNCAGVCFEVASSELSLEEIGDLAYPHPAFQQLIIGKPDDNGLEDQPLTHFQVTTFKCGGSALGISNNHTIFDGPSFKIFLENLASVAAGKPLTVVPFNDRRLLAARSPPCITFDHKEMAKLEIPLAGDPQVNILESGKENLASKVFRLSEIDISNLKEKAKMGSGSGPKITSFNVVTAHIWRCKVLATTRGQPDKDTSVLYAIDLRSRIRPPLPHSYTGNAVLMGYGSATHRDLEEGRFSHLVEAVRQGASRMTDEYARSIIDWGQLNKGFPHGDVIVSSWWRLGFTDVHFPWGKPLYSCPVMIPNGDIVVLFPDIEGNEVVNVFVTLPAEAMEKFQTLFRKFLELE